MAFKSDVLDVIACIECGGDVEYIEKSDKLKCKNCHKEYNLIDGIPMMGGIDDRAENSEIYK